MRLKGFVGPFNTNQSWNFDREATINRYAEVADAGNPKSQGYLPPTPGVRPFITVPAGPIRNLFEINGQCFALAGDLFVELFANQQYAIIGDVANNNRRGSIVSNGDAGHQVLVESGGKGYIYDLISQEFGQITDESFPTYIVSARFSDGYFIVLDTTGAFQLSTLEDGTEWNALDRALVSEAADRVIAMELTHRELWLFGSKTSEPWQNNGRANFPYEPTAGTLIETGIAAPDSTSVLDNTIFWLAADERGGGMVMRAQGFVASRISTFAVEDYIQSLPRFDNAIGFCYQDRGHLFYWLYLPNAEHALVYDVATQQWHQRSHWNDTLIRDIPHLARCHAYAFKRHLVGDRFGPTIYELNDGFYSDLLTEFFPVFP